MGEDVGERVGTQPADRVVAAAWLLAVVAWGVFARGSARPG